MKTLLLMAAAIIGIQSHAGMIICANIADGEVTDFLRIDGLLDDQGDLSVRPDRDSMITLISRRSNFNFSQGFNINPNKDLVPMGHYWKKEKLQSAGLRVRLNRDDNGVITAKAADSASGIDFTSCQYVYEKGDTEAVQAKAKALEEMQEDPELVEVGTLPHKDTERFPQEPKETVDAIPY